MTDYQIPVPDCWRSSDLTDAQRDALEAVAALNERDDPTGNLGEAVSSAQYALRVSKNKPELTLLMATLDEVHGADLGYSVRFPSIRTDPEGRRRITTKATILPDLLVEFADLPPAYQGEAALNSPESPAVIVARITMVDSGKETVTVELFSKTDQYEVEVPDSIVLDSTCLNGNTARRRRAVYDVLAREFGGQ